MLTAFGTAGTGGFGFVADSMEHFSNYSQYVISTFLILFGINFSLYFLILIGKIKAVFKNEELRVYFGVVFAAIALVMFDLIFDKVNSFAELRNINFEETFRISFFQVASIITTAGYTNANFDLWPELSKMVLIILMLTGRLEIFPVLILLVKKHGKKCKKMQTICLHLFIMLHLESS